jgi:hypothetical protein
MTHLVAGRRAPTQRRPQHGRSLLLLPLLALATAAASAFLYLGYMLWPRWPGPPVGRDAPPIPVSIAGVVFNIPPAAIRIPVQRRPGAQERVDLAFLWPSLEPPDPNPKPAPPSSHGEAADSAPVIERIFVTIARAGETLDPTERVLNIYPRYTAAETREGPADLTVLAFREGTPYQGEDLIYDATTPGFLVRCTRNGPGAMPGTCLYERRITEADVVLRFPRDWLGNWRMVASQIEQLITRLHPST